MADGTHPATGADGAPPTEDGEEAPASHHIAVVKQANGELVEDVVPRHVVEGDADDRSDGADGPLIVDASPMPETERPHPEAPLPSTIPRED